MLGRIEMQMGNIRRNVRYKGLKTRDKCEDEKDKVYKKRCGGCNIRRKSKWEKEERA